MLHLYTNTLHLYTNMLHSGFVRFPVQLAVVGPPDALHLLIEHRHLVLLHFALQEPGQVAFVE